MKEALLAAREALKDAATSLETINRLAGKSHYVGDNGERIETFMGHHDEVRGYACSRASESRKALALIDAALAQPEWTMPEPAMYYMNATGHSSACYTEQQMRAAFEAGRRSHEMQTL